MLLKIFWTKLPKKIRIPAFFLDPRCIWRMSHSKQICGNSYHIITGSFPLNRLNIIFIVKIFILSNRKCVMPWQICDTLGDASYCDTKICHVTWIVFAGMSLMIIGRWSTRNAVKLIPSESQSNWQNTRRKAENNWKLIPATSLIHAANAV